MKTIVHIGAISKWMIVVNCVIAIVYFSWWFQPGNAGNPVLYGLLFFGEAYHVVMALTFWHTIWPSRRPEQIEHVLSSSILSKGYAPSVDIFITVAGEPVEVVRETAKAAKEINYPRKKVYILNDGYVAKSDNWKEIEQLAKTLGIGCITRKNPGGAKAGNINNALRQTKGELVVIFDADMVPYNTFLEKTVGYFQNEKVGFVQTPQYYSNSDDNEITRGSWEQQDFFFGPIMQGKDSWNSAFICGTNVVIRRTALEQAGGMCEDNIAEDFLTSLYIHQDGWKSHYVTEVLSTGLAPLDLLSYYKQQLRWARGSLEVLFTENPLFKKNLTWQQKVQYLSSGLYYLNGLIVLIDITIPIINLFTGLQPVRADTTSFAIYFIPFIFLSMATVYQVSAGHMTFRAISFSQSSFMLQLQALYSIITKHKMKFAVTSKAGLKGRFLSIALPHITYAIIFIIAFGVGFVREGFTPSLVTNTAWGMFNVFMFLPFIRSALS